MFGISWSEFLVIFLVAMLVLPARMWPDVARFLARAVNVVRRVVWKITDAAEEMKQQIDLEKPIDDLIKSTTKDVLADFSEPIKQIKKRAVKKSGGKKK